MVTRWFSGGWRPLPAAVNAIPAVKQKKVAAKRLVWDETTSFSVF